MRNPKNIKWTFIGKPLNVEMTNLRGGPEPSPLTNDEVLDYEKTTGTSLPADYRRFLLEIGGCSTILATMVRPINQALCPGFHSDATEFTLFFGKKSDPENLWGYYAMCQEYLPASVVPIGTNLNGHLFCLGVAGPELGKVFYYDRDYGTLYLFGNSLQDFLGRLERNPDYTN